MHLPRLSPVGEEALAVATRQRAGPGQHYLGVEHLFLALAEKRRAELGKAFTTQKVDLASYVDMLRQRNTSRTACMQWQCAVECHGKGPCDAYFSTITRRLETWTKSRWVTDVDSMVAALRECAKEHPYAGAAEYLFGTMPSISRTAFAAQCLPPVANSLPLGLRSASGFKFQLNDVRRKRLLGVDGLTTTAVNVYGCQRPGEAATAFTFLRCPAPPPAAAPAASTSAGCVTADGAGSEDELEEIVAPTQFENNSWGWRVSYRTMTPEVHSRDTILARCVRRQRAFAGVPLPQGRRVLAAVRERLSARTA